jgi:LacI family transcriptional regulator
MKKYVTIREIAHALDLHHSTVSLALRDSPLLKAETKQKIKDFAEKLGYRPDPMLNALSAYRLAKRPAFFHAVIAWINNWHDRDGLLSNPTYRAYYAGAHACAQKLGFDLQEFWMHESGMNPRKLKEIFKARNIQGVLLPPQAAPGTHVELDFTDLYVVTFGYSMQPRNLHLVTNHHAQTLDLLMEKIVELGYRRPGYCIPQVTDIGNNYIWLTRTLYLTARYPQLQEISRSPADNKGFLKWLKTQRPDVLIGFNDFLPRIESAGLKVPDDIGFVSVCVDTNNPRISGADQNDFFIGETAVNVLVGMITHNARGIPSVPMRTLVDSVWYRGETVRRPEDAALPVRSPGKKKEKWG